jgi:hypothetical protein
LDENVAYRIADISDARRFLWVEEARHAIAVAITVNREISNPQYFTVLLRPEVLFSVGSAMKNREKFMVSRTIEDGKSGCMFHVRLLGQRAPGDYDRYTIRIESDHEEADAPYEVTISGREADAIGEFFCDMASSLFQAAVRSNRRGKYITTETAGMMLNTQPYDEKKEP